jgi:hypothetical protein
MVVPVNRDESASKAPVWVVVANGNLLGGFRHLATDATEMTGVFRKRHSELLDESGKMSWPENVFSRTLSPPRRIRDI